MNSQIILLLRNYDYKSSIKSHIHSALRFRVRFVSSTTGRHHPEHTRQEGYARDHANGWWEVDLLSNSSPPF